MNTDYKDRKAGLVVFGALLLVVGLGCGAMVPLMILGTVAGAAMAPEVATPVSMMIPGILFYVAVAAWFIWTGIGSILARRWAWKVILVCSWIGLICGIAGMIGWFLVAPEMYAAMAQEEEIPAAMLQVIQVVTALFLGVIYILGPGILILFYRSPHVRATCEARDPVERWTDRCPGHPLALSFIFWLFAGSILMVAGYNFALPMFGTIITGLPGALVTVFLCLANVWIAWNLYKLRPKAWWGALAMLLAYALSSLITFTRVTMMDYYKAMNFPEDSLRILNTINLEITGPMGIYMAVYVAAFVAYLSYAKRFFPAPQLNPEPNPKT